MAGKKKTKGRRTTSGKARKATTAKKPRAATKRSEPESRTIDLLRGWSPSRYSTR